MVRPASAAALALALTVAAGAQSRYTRQDADQFGVKLHQIVEFGQKAAAGRAAPRSTPISDAEVNAYFRHHGREQVPVGILEPEITALGEGRVGGRAIVDLDAVRTQKPRGWTDPMGYLTGRLPVTATGRLTTKDGVGRFVLESAEISGVTVPKTLVQELVSYYSKTPENPAGISMDDPFELPARIREIRVGRAQAVIVQ